MLLVKEEEEGEIDNVEDSEVVSTDIGEQESNAANMNSLSGLLNP